MEELKTLIMRAQAGDPDAYGGIVRRFQDMAVGYGYSILGDFHLAQDAAQEAFVEAYFALPNLREPAAFAGWFGRIVFKQCDRLTRGKRVATVPLEDAAEVATNALDPAELVERAEAQEEVRAAIRALPEKEGAVTTLFYISDYSHKEIGAFLGIPVTTVKNRLYSARNRLRERMIAKVKKNLHEQRPSRSEGFAASVIEILRASARGDRQRVEQLLDQDASLIGAHDDAEHGHPGITVLHYAAEAGHIEVVQMLLDRGADVNAVESSHGLTPLGWATLRPKQKTEVAKLLLARGAKLEIFSAAALGMKAEVEAMLQQDPTQVHRRLSRSDEGMQPLHVAAWQGHQAVVELLLARGADPNARDGSNKTPLDRAEEAGHAEVAGLLRQRGGSGG